MTHDEIIEAIEILKANPIEQMWKPKDFGKFEAERIPCDEMSGSSFICNEHDGLQDLYQHELDGVRIQVNRKPNTHWLEESGQTYLVWKR